MLLDGAFRALGQLCIFRCITTSDLSTELPLPTLLDKIQESAKLGEESAIAAIGQVSVALDANEDGELRKIIERLHSLHELRQSETQFAVGEALACAACSWGSSAMAPKFQIEGPMPRAMDRSMTFETLIEQTFQDSAHPKNSLRKVRIRGH